LGSVQERTKEPPFWTRDLNRGQLEVSRTSLASSAYQSATAKHFGEILGLGGADGQQVSERTILGQVSTLAQLAGMDDTDPGRARVAELETGQLLVQRRVELIRQAKASR
jgi:hypothetical protein